MTWLPIVERELRVAAGRKSTFRLRLLSTVLVTGVSALFLLIAAFDRSPRLGVPLFYTLSLYALVLCVLAGVFTTADCLSEEKREGTLGLWLALTIKKPQYAVALTLLFVVFLPGLLFCVPKIAVDLFCIFWSRDKLRQGLRDQLRRVALPHSAIGPPPRIART